MDAAPSNCPRCGSVVPAEAAAGLCPRCLAVGALSALLNPDSIPSDHAGEATLSIVVPVDEPGTPPGGGTIRYFGDYELLQKAGEGGMGVIWKARQISLNRIVAVKMVRLGKLAGDADRQRFRTEAEAAARLQHPNIVALHEVGEHDGQPYFSMEYVEGRSLAELVREQPLEPAHAARLVKAVAEAIHYAHQRGVLHRDLKPSNVMCDARDQPRVTDFGLAKLMHSDSELTRTGAVMGSPSYMPPEQAAGRLGDMNERSDVYSMGAVLYELITGQAPFRAATMAIIIRLVDERDPIAPRALNPALPRDLETICLKCLAKAPSSRYATAQDLADELGRFLRDEPIRARPSGTPEKVWRWCRRKPGLAGALATAAAIFLAGATGVVWQWRRAEGNAAQLREKSRVEEQRLFVADTALALQAWRENRFSSARARVDAHRHETNRHDFVWRYLDRCTQAGNELTLGGHTGTVVQIAFAPDNKSLATRGKDLVLRMWSLPSGAERFALSNVTALAGFLANGRRVALGLGSNDVALCDADSGRVTQTLTNAGWPFATLADGKSIATTSRNFELRLWDTESGEPRLAIPVPGWVRFLKPVNEVYEVLNAMIGISADGKRLVVIEVSSEGFGFALWDVESRTKLDTIEDNSPSPEHLRSIKLSPDGHRLAFGRSDGFIKVLDLEQRPPTTTMFPAHRGGIRSLAFMPDGRSIVSGGQDQNAHVFGLGTQRAWNSFLGHQSDVWAVAVSTDGRLVATGDRDGVVKVWDTFATRESEPFSGAMHETHHHYHPICFSADSTRIVVEAADQNLPVLDSSTLQVLSTIPSRGAPIGFTADGTQFLFGVRSLRSWDFGEAAVVKTVEFKLENRLTDARGAPRISAREYTPDRSVVAFASLDLDIILCDARSGAARGTLPSTGNLIQSVLFLPDGKTLLSQDTAGFIHFWDFAQQRQSGVLAAHNEMHAAMALLSDGRTLATGGADGTVKLWDVATKTARATLPNPGHEIFSLAVAPDGRTLACGDAEGLITLWNVPLGQETGTLRFFDEHAPRQSMTVDQLAFSPDGHILAGRTVGGILRVWRGTTGVTGKVRLATNSKPSQ